MSHWRKTACMSYSFFATEETQWIRSDTGALGMNIPNVLTHAAAIIQDDSLLTRTLAGFGDT